MKNIELAKLLFEMKPGDPPSLHIGDKWYTMWNSNTVEEAWVEAEKTGLIPDREHDWIALKEVLQHMFDQGYIISLGTSALGFTAELDDGYRTFYRIGTTLEEAVLNVVIKALTFNQK